MKKKKSKKNPAAVALGSIRTDKKSKASRENGKLGGRPKKYVPSAEGALEAARELQSKIKEEEAGGNAPSCMFCARGIETVEEVAKFVKSLKTGKSSIAVCQRHAELWTDYARG